MTGGRTDLMTDARTNEGESIGPFRLQPGTNKAKVDNRLGNILANLVIRKLLQYFFSENNENRFFFFGLREDVGFPSYSLPCNKQAKVSQTRIMRFVKIILNY